jgi:hypothetical protein
VLSIFPYFKVVACVSWMGSDVCYTVCDLCLRRKKADTSNKAWNTNQILSTNVSLVFQFTIGVTSVSAAEPSGGHCSCGLNQGSYSWKQMSLCFVTWLRKWDAHWDHATAFWQNIRTNDDYYNIYVFSSDWWVNQNFVIVNVFISPTFNASLLIHQVSYFNWCCGTFWTASEY